MQNSTADMNVCLDRPYAAGAAPDSATAGTASAGASTCSVSGNA
jgi:hypothetical protein